uniref:Cupin type-1 domain-containing protein n=2 Tax=Aegilops tauschii subsp. strangulata TaxID=200361 RepID=A0A453M1G5_AEGTS
MKSTVVRSPWLALALVLSLCLSLSFASWDAEDEGRGSRRWQEGGDERRSGESGRPYHFGEESFREWAKSRHGHFKVLERFDHELLRGSIGDYRVACLDAAPRAFLQPSHYDADEIAFVREGEGVLVLLRNGKRESFCVREGDVFVIPAGSIVYSANTHRSKWFRVVMLLNPVSTPGSFQVSHAWPQHASSSAICVACNDLLLVSVLDTFVGVLPYWVWRRAAAVVLQRIQRRGYPGGI